MWAGIIAKRRVPAHAEQLLISQLWVSQRVGQLRVDAVTCAAPLPR